MNDGCDLKASKQYGTGGGGVIALKHHLTGVRSEEAQMARQGLTFSDRSEISTAHLPIATNQEEPSKLRVGDARRDLT